MVPAVDNMRMCPPSRTHTRRGTSPAEAAAAVDMAGGADHMGPEDIEAEGNRTPAAGPQPDNPGDDTHMIDTHTDRGTGASTHMARTKAGLQLKMT